MKVVAVMKTGLLLLTLITLSCPMAQAAIGLNASSIPADCSQLNGTYSVVTAGSLYECNTTTIKIDFFTNSQGVITRIAWKGRRTPALNVLLGSYANEYEQGFNNAPKNMSMRRSIVHETTNLVVHRGGNARSHVGEIVLKSATP
jgi:hypothetical protein